MRRTTALLRRQRTRSTELAPVLRARTRDDVSVSTWWPFTAPWIRMPSSVAFPTWHHNWRPHALRLPPDRLGR